MDEIIAKAYLVKLEDGYHVESLNGDVGPVCDKRTTDGYIKLSDNEANRKCYNEKAAEKFFAENPDGKIPLAYKETRSIGPKKDTYPNMKLIAYLSEDLQAEYKAIIDRAREAQQADKAKPLTEKEKLEAKIAKAKAALAKLTAEAESMTDGSGIDTIVE